MICKASQDEAVHAEMIGAQDVKELAIENLAEDLMSNVEQKISSVLMQSSKDFKLTRADVRGLCDSEEFNNLFYAMASKLIK